MVEWLLKNGVTNVNSKFMKKTPMDLALEKGYEGIVGLLKVHGGKASL